MSIETLPNIKIEIIEWKSDQYKKDEMLKKLKLKLEQIYSSKKLNTTLIEKFGKIIDTKSKIQSSPSRSNNDNQDDEGQTLPAVDK